jgi:hypothetical protein
MHSRISGGVFIDLGMGDDSPDKKDIPKTLKVMV